MNVEHEISPFEEVAGTLPSIANRTRQKLFLKEMDELIAKPIDRTMRDVWDRKEREDKEKRDAEIGWTDPKTGLDRSRLE